MIEGRTAGIDDEGVADRQRVDLVGMADDQNVGVEAGQALAPLGESLGTRLARRVQQAQPAGLFGRRLGVHDVEGTPLDLELQRRRQRREVRPVALARIRRLFQVALIVIAGNRPAIACDQQVDGRRKRLEVPGDIARADDVVDAAPFELLQRVLQCRGSRVDVADDADAGTHAG